MDNRPAHDQAFLSNQVSGLRRKGECSKDIVCLFYEDIINTSF
jgi:hypothetical protein